MLESRELVIWTHDAATSPADAILNYDLLGTLNAAESILEVGWKVPAANQSSSFGAVLKRSRGRCFVVSPIPLSTDIKKKTPNLQFSLSSQLAAVVNINSRSIVTVHAVPKAAHVADFMVLYFKDQYISRSDMWRAACNLEGECIYVGKRITFSAGIRADVREIWRGGKKKFSAYVSATTKPVFRSESARYLIFIQMSKEMWEFEEDGELFYNKAIDGFLPELFKRWKAMNAHHLLSIVLFTRVQYAGVSGPFCLPRGSGVYTDEDFILLRSQLEQTYHNDFYKIVVDNVSSNNWESTLVELRRELHGFSRDVLAHKLRVKSGIEQNAGHSEITAARHGNILEAINLAAHQFNRDYIDRDLLRTGTSMLFVTAGTGVFEVDARLLKLTGESLLGNGIGMDIVCLSRRPLHVVPLFKYKKDKAGNGSASSSTMDDYEYVLPYITEISYYGEYSPEVTSPSQLFQPRLKMHELQILGKAEPDMSKASVEQLCDHALFRGNDLSKYSAGMDTRLDLYDEMCFASKSRTQEILEIASATFNQCTTPGEEATKLLSTSIPSSGERKDFKGFYEKSRTGNSVYSSKASGLSGDSPISHASAESLVSMNEHKGSSPTKTRARMVRFMKKFSEKADRSTELAPVRQTAGRAFFNPGAAILQTKSRASVVSMPGTVTVSANAKTIVTKGFMSEHYVESPELQPNPHKASAIPIHPQDITNEAVGKRMMTSIDVGEARAQSVSQALRSNRLNSKPSRASVTVKYKTAKPEAPDASPWHILANPNYARKNSSTSNTKAWRWAHVSDRARRTGDMNWESMCAPAALPLTASVLIDMEELKSANYTENSYSIYIDTEAQSLSQRDLMREMIGQRLVQGFQIAEVPVQGRALSLGYAANRHQASRGSFDAGPLGDMGNTVYLTHAQMEVQCITCDNSSSSIEVTRYVRRREVPDPIGYSSLIWQLAQDDGYDDNLVVFRPLPTDHSWNYVDQIICGLEKRFTDSVRFWRARFLIIPSDVKDKRGTLPKSVDSEEFSEEEIRLAGINKFCELLQKATYLTPGEVKESKRSASPITVTFATLDPVEHIQHEQKHFHMNDHEPNRASDTSQRILIAKNLSSYDLSEEMQSVRGITIKDRLWHWRWYESSWIGTEFVTWLLEKTDLQTREEAIQFAREHMKKGFFEHVGKSHGFLDGFYLYRLKGEHKTAKGWFGSRKVTPNVATTRARASSAVTSSTVNSPVLRPQGKRPRYDLSKWLRVDVDPHKKSNRPEFVSVHYDRYEEA